MPESCLVRSAYLKSSWKIWQLRMLKPGLMSDLFKLLSQEHLRTITRRQFFGRCATGIGSMALASLLNEKLLGSGSASIGANTLGARAPHFAPKAKRAIYLHMAG